MSELGVDIAGVMEAVRNLHKCWLCCDDPTVDCDEHPMGMAEEERAPIERAVRLGQIAYAERVVKEIRCRCSERAYAIQRQCDRCIALATLARQHEEASR